MAIVTGMTAAKILELFTGKASTTHAETHAAAGSDPVSVSSAQIADLTETVQDIVGAFIVAGTNVTVTYNDAANTFTINATASGGTTDPEIVRDVIGAAMVAGSGIQITVNDASDQITIASTAVPQTRQILTGGGIVGGGDLSANRSLSLNYGTTAGTVTQGNDSRLSDARTPTTHAATHASGGSDPVAIASSQITDLAEAVQDIVGAFIVAGTNVTVSHDDAANTFTINATASGGGSTDPEVVRDVIGAAMVAGSGIQITVNDAGDTITIASTAVLPTRQVIAGTGLTGGGDLSADRTLSVLYGSSEGTAAQGNDARLSNARTPTAHASTHASGGSDALAVTNLGVGSLANGQMLVRSGSALVGQAVPSGGGLAWSGVGVGRHLPVWAIGGHRTFPIVTTRIIPCPLVAVEAMNVDAVSIYVDTGVATSTIDLALYTYNLATGAPESFVQHLATIDTSTAGLKTETFAPIALAAGIHVVVARANNADVSLWGVANSMGICRMLDPGAGSSQYAFPHASWTGAVPSWPSSPTWDWYAGIKSTDAQVPKLQLRRSA